MDEPETAMSPKTQLDLLEVLDQTGWQGAAQFLVATHSPILLACPGAQILSFDRVPVQQVRYEDTEHFKVYKSFFENRGDFLQGPK